MDRPIRTGCWSLPVLLATIASAIAILAYVTGADSLSDLLGRSAPTHTPQSAGAPTEPGPSDGGRSTEAPASPPTVDPDPPADRTVAPRDPSATADTGSARRRGRDPLPYPDTVPDPAPLGHVFAADGLEIALIRGDVRTAADSEPAAVHAIFALANRSNERRLIEYDRAMVSVVDAAQQRYVDWDGGGIDAFYLEPGRVQHIVRYYASGPEQETRIPREVLPATLEVEALDRLAGLRWQLGGPPVPVAAPVASAADVGEWYRAGDFEIAVVRAEVRTLADQEDAAAHVWYEVRNAGSSRRVFEANLAQIFLEDRHGNRYIDWEGAEVVATWVESGRSFAFDRYYSLAHHVRSRVPADTSHVSIVCDALPRLGRLQWTAEVP